MIDDDDEFDRLVAPVLAAARAEDARLPEGLSARVLADAARVREGWQAGARAAAPAPKLSVWQQLMGALGGVPALGGMMAACATGIWLGAAPPQQFDPLGYVVSTNTVLGYYTDMQDAILGGEAQ
ncbi:hypothetical protein [Marinibacterium profundimaris]|uniref:hypothetical protein n=1 Tax=Marinibacterium profundimaris TaxID=1679460 RepID=UPI000B522FF5|nr:hypothetical protein [Marinibacterium profundimaris]